MQYDSRQCSPSSINKVTLGGCTVSQRPYSFGRPLNTSQLGADVMSVSDKTILTSDKIIRVSGKVFYNDRRRRIDIKKPIRDLFESAIDVFYTMELCLSKEKVKERTHELAENNIVPVLLYFERK